MVRSLLLRIGQAVVVLLAAYTVTFGVLRLVPGDPVSVMLTSGGHEINTAAPEQIATLTAKFGLDKSIQEQYISQLEGMLRGDFGFYYTTGNPVLGEIVAHADGTLDLIRLALLLTVCLGLLLACISALIQ